MQPLIVLVIVFLLLVLPLGWWTALWIALGVMFLLTASAHWGKRKADLIRMVPPGLARPDLLVTITGFCEILVAVGLLISRTAPIAALGLTLLLIALFPATVRTARRGTTGRGSASNNLAIEGRHPNRLSRSHNWRDGWGKDLRSMAYRHASRDRPKEGH